MSGNFGTRVTGFEWNFYDTMEQGHMTNNPSEGPYHFLPRLEGPGQLPYDGYQSTPVEGEHQPLPPPDSSVIEPAMRLRYRYIPPLSVTKFPDHPFL